MSPKVVKCVIIGDSVINTADLIMQRLVGQLRNGNKHVEGCEYGVIQLVLDNEPVILQLKDLKITDCFSHVWRMHCRGANCAILMFDTNTYDYVQLEVPELIDQIRNIAGQIPVLLLGFYIASTDLVRGSKEEVEELFVQYPRVFYQEFDVSNQNLTAVLAPAAVLGLNQLGVPINNVTTNTVEIQSITERLKEIEQEKRAEFKELIVAVEELGLNVDENYKIELESSRGIFTIDIIENTVHFRPLGCTSCKRFGCMTRYNSASNTLCIVPESQGWSNLGLKAKDLIILSEILAIQDNKLPQHVLDQIDRICPGFCNAPLPRHPNAVGSVLSDPSAVSEETGAHGIYQITAAEAQVLLRRYSVQYKMGQLPYRVYASLKRRYRRILETA
jgi:hypothetical protein